MPVVLMWVPQGLVPSTAAFTPAEAERLCFARQEPGGLIEAVLLAMAERGNRRDDRLMPWIRVRTGEGAALFDEQGIVAISQAGIQL